MTTPDDVSLSPLSVDPMPLLNALDAAAAVFDARGALRCKNDRMAKLINNGTQPFSSFASETAAKVRLHRARQKLKETLYDVGPEARVPETKPEGAARPRMEMEG